MTHRIVVTVETGVTSIVEYTAEEQAVHDAAVAAQVASEAAAAYHGLATICLLGSNSWAFSCTTADAPVQAQMHFGAGSVALSGTLDRVRLTTVGGTATFDAGSVNIMYEG